MAERDQARNQERQCIQEALPNNAIKRLRQISEILVGSDNHHGIFLSEVATALDTLHPSGEQGDG